MGPSGLLWGWRLENGGGGCFSDANAGHRTLDGVWRSWGCLSTQPAALAQGRRIVAGKSRRGSGVDARARGAV